MIVMELIIQFLYLVREIAHSWLSCIMYLAVHQVTLSVSSEYAALENRCKEGTDVGCFSPLNETFPTSVMEFLDLIASSHQWSHPN